MVRARVPGAGAAVVRAGVCPAASIFEHREIGAGIGAGERGGGGGAIGKGYGEILLAADGMFGGDDHAGTPEDSARRESWAGVHRDYIAPRQFDGCRDFIGKGSEFVCHVYLL